MKQLWCVRACFCVIGSEWGLVLRFNFAKKEKNSTKQMFAKQARSVKINNWVQRGIGTKILVTVSSTWPDHHHHTCTLISLFHPTPPFFLGSVAMVGWWYLSLNVQIPRYIPTPTQILWGGYLFFFGFIHTRTPTPTHSDVVIHKQYAVTKPSWESRHALCLQPKTRM